MLATSCNAFCEAPFTSFRQPAVCDQAVVFLVHIALWFQRRCVYYTALIQLVYV